MPQSTLFIWKIDSDNKKSAEPNQSANRVCRAFRGRAMYFVRGV
jgi:hypothetical protein